MDLQTTKPLNFEQIEALRKKMLLTQEQMARLFGVSRITYYNWRTQIVVVPRQYHMRKVREAVRKLLDIMADYQWPAPDVRELPSDVRFKHLQQLVDRYE